MDMKEPERTAIGRLLADAVPPLPEPADRIGQLRARMRRTRARRAALAAGSAVAAVALALAAPLVMPGGEDDIEPALDAASCPALTDELGEPGSLVPEGAIEAMLCERAVVDQPAGRRGAVIRSSVLHTGVDELVAALNRPPADVPSRAQPTCGDLARRSQLSLVLRYPVGGTTTILIPSGCRAEYSDRELDAHIGAHAGVLAEFERLYRAQQAATDSQ